ncbi:hypothetical protein KY333_01655 [Candidatus Woesearchaeota archaeon]|nr:hypothetical protein [Candidatus Woesearchaeota archaeon]
MNKKILLLLVACVVISLATFVYAGDTACGIGGCSPTTITTTTGATTPISLSQQGTLTTNSLTLTVLCNTNATCFNISSINSYVVCNATSGMYCDANPARSYEYLNQQVNHTNLTNVSQVVVSTGSLVTMTTGVGDTGKPVLDGTHNTADVVGNNGVRIETNFLAESDDIRIYNSPTADNFEVVQVGKDATNKILVIRFKFSAAGLIDTPIIINTGVSATPGTTTDIADYTNSEMVGADTWVALLNYDKPNKATPGTGAITVGGKSDGSGITFGRELNDPAGVTELEFATDALAVCNDIPVQEESGNSYTTSTFTGTVKSNARANLAEIVTGIVYSDGIISTSSPSIETYGDGVNDLRADNAVKVVDGSTNTATSGQYIVAGVALPAMMSTKYDSTTLTSITADYLSTGGAVNDPSGGFGYGETAIMGTNVVLGGGSLTYQGYESTDGESRIAVWDNLGRNLIKLYKTSGGSTGVEAVQKASQRVNPTVYVAKITQSNNNTGTRVIVLEGSSLATAFEIYNFTTDSGDALNFVGTGGHSGDYLDYVLGGRFPEQTNSSIWLDYFNTSLELSAVNPNGTTRFTTDKQVVIQTMHPDINILNFQLDFQSFNGTFDTTLGTCVNCSYDLSNGTCQAEVEKVWGMFQNYRLNMTLTSASAITMTNLTLECRTANATVTKNANCAGLFSAYGVGSDGCVSWLAVPGRSWTFAANGGIGIDMTGFTSASFGMGNITPTATCEQIACEVTGVWKPGDDQEFVMNKTITVTAI